MRCETCQKEIVRITGDSGWSDWLKLSFYLDHEFNEGEITQQTYEDLQNALLTFKPKPED